ncbi:hypothetical protein HYV69_03100 [Candidatus Uhrbacteria bacterium]|nr:hypothetical protein [Candidatus Uhrbacteria bacterium]
MDFPVIVLKTGKESIPDGPAVIIIAKNGKFLLKRLGIVEAAVPYTDQISGLAEYETWAELNVEKIPFEIFIQVFHFMRTIYNNKKTECNVILFYHQKEKQWAVVVPPQIVSHSSVHYQDGIAGAKDGWIKVGTLHSHCDFSAGHSGGDHRDEEHFDGIHITLGHVDKDEPTLSVSLVVNGMRFMKTPQEYIAGVKRVEEKEMVQEYETKWVDGDDTADESHAEQEESLVTSMCTLVTRFLPKFGGGEIGGTSNTYVKPSWPTKVYKYRPQKRIEVPTKMVERTVSRLVFDFPEGKKVEDYEFPQEWLDNVKTSYELHKMEHPVRPRRRRKFRDAGVSKSNDHQQESINNEEEETAYTCMTDDELAEIISRHQRGCQEGEE